MLSNEIPLLLGKPSDSSIINPIDFIRYIRKRKGEVPKIPENLIVSFKYMRIEETIRQYNPHIEPIFGEENPVYIFDYKGMKVAYCNLRTGGIWLSTYP